MSYRMGRSIPTSAVTIPGVTGAYSAYSALGSAFEIPYAVGNQGALLVQLNVIDRATGMSGIRFHFYQQVPPAVADKSAFTIPSGQENGYLGFVDATAWVTAGITGGNTSVQSQNTDVHLNLYNGSVNGSTRSVWCQAQALNAMTFGGLNSAQTVRLSTIQD